MSSRIARLLIGMAVAVAIVPLGIGAVGSAGAHPSGMRLAARDDRRYSYYRHPMTTSCIGHRGFYSCTSF